MSEHGHKFNEIADIFNESADIFNEIAGKSHGHAIKSRGDRGLFAEDRGSLLPGAYDTNLTATGAYDVSGNHYLYTKIMPASIRTAQRHLRHAAGMKSIVLS